MRFTFSLQRVLDLKVQLEEQQKIELQKLVAQSRQLQKQIKDLEDKLFDIEDKAYSKKEISSAEILLLAEFREHLLHEIDKKEQELRECEERIEKKKKEVLEAIKERKKLEKLKEKAYIKFLTEEKKAEQKEIDEHASIKKEIF